ncbi:hypothetical protein PRK78_002636 [Emydomyces testavorans]|uniref:Bromo domain-containing protein n=1 Tax=Emydomyces testavorans TaxID=2070801 RepID=A0AAF0DEP2_9EURO|nr:hypothetical protein PRK78_002636 [Emydomyces testavorans]
MPSLSSYTPFESLLFFQSLAGLDKPPESFSPISDLLKNNPFVRQDATFDVNRLSPQALEELYTDVAEGSGGELFGRKGPEEQRLPNGQQDGLASPPNSKKRKIALPEDGSSHLTIISGLISRLYARYKELVTKEIQEEERRYRDLKDDLSRIQSEQQTEPATPSASLRQIEPQPKPTHIPGDTPKQDTSLVEMRSGNGSRTTQEIPRPLQSTPKATPSIPTTLDPSRRGIQQTAPSSVTQYRFENKTPQSMQAYHQAPQGINTTQQTPVNIQPTTSVQIQNVGTPIQPHTQTPTFPAPPSGTPIVPMLSSATSSRIQPGPPQVNSSVGARPSPAKPAMQGRMIQPWSIHSLPQPQQHVSPYANAPRSTVPPPGKPPQALQLLNHGDKLLSPIPQNAFALAAAGSNQASITTAPKPAIEIGKASQSTPCIPGSGPSEANAPALPLDRRPKIPPLHTWRSRTPWKRLNPLEIPKYPGSPVRPRAEDISPISETELSPMEGVKLPAEAAQGVETETLKKDLESPVTGSPGRRITPALRKGRSKSPLSPFTMQTRRRARSNISRDDETEGSKIKNEFPGTPIVTVDKSGSKRKRTTSEPVVMEDAQVSAQHVVCTRNFPRTCGPVMNDIAAHKHASIFAKPLTERDAPGYKDLVYRPQDIKSIKSAIHQGSKAVATASEALNVSGMENDLSGTSKGNGLVLKRTAELIPPKGIVNSSQLEKELIRMFANAVMFNPTPEDTFGPAFPMRSDFASREQTSEPEEGGILHDTLEMYEDAERAVSTWRAAERAVDDMGAKAGTSALRGQSGDGNGEGVDD